MPSTIPLTLRHSSEFSKIDKCAVALSSSLAIRVYSDTRPHNWHIAALQKGLVLAYKGLETVGEGVGFGVPVLLYGDETYFSGSSKVCFHKQDNYKIIRKEFLMDKVPRKRIRKTKLKNQKLASANARISRYLAGVYQRHRRLRFLTVERLSKILGVHTDFEKAIPAGKVTVTYGIRQCRIHVKVDLSLLKRKNLQKIFVLNEQGSRFFSRYMDLNGTELVDRRIGAWETIEADWACITDIRGRVGFRLWRTKNSILRRGREFLKDCRDWVGLDYEINPRNAVFEYEIEILGRSR